MIMRFALFYGWVLASVAGCIAVQQFSPNKLDTQILNNDAMNRPIPFRIIEGSIVVAVKINGKGPFDIVIDSGGGGSHVVSTKVAEAALLQTKKKFIGGSAGPSLAMVSHGKAPIVFANGHQHVGKVSSTRLPFGVSLAGSESENLIGTLGSPLFHEYVVEFDFESSEMLLHEVDTWEPEQELVRVEAPTSIFTKIASVRVQLNDIDTRLLVDTGASPAFVVDSSLAKRASMQHLPGGPLISSSGGIIESSKVVAKSFQYGGILFKDLAGISSEESSFPKRKPGVIGLGVLSCNHLWIALPLDAIFIGKKQKAVTCEL